MVGLCFMLVQFVQAGTNGPQVIDFIGFDRTTNSVVLTRTNWSEEGCAIALYTYCVDDDSLAIDPAWHAVVDFEQRKAEILADVSLSGIEPLNSSDIPYFIAFKWEQPVKYFSTRTNQNTYNRPFSITVFRQQYNYYQCSSASNEPNVIHLHIDSDSGLVFINFQGDCDEGYWCDSVIYYSRKNGQFFSRKITPNDVSPINTYKTAALENETF